MGNRISFRRRHEAVEGDELDPDMMPAELTELSHLDNVTVKQVESGLFSGNKYLVLTPEGQQILKAKEKGLFCCGGSRNRPFSMQLFGTGKKPVIKLKRPEMWVGATKLNVFIRDEKVCVVRKKDTISDFILTVTDVDSKEPTYEVTGPTYGDNNVVIYEVHDLAGNSFGSIRKQWNGFINEMISNPDTYHVSFGEDNTMDVKHKVAVIGTCILIDIKIYE